MPAFVLAFHAVASGFGDPGPIVARGCALVDVRRLLLH
jgi:hypothetical protein